MGSDKNRKNVSRARAKTNTSETTFLSNNAIQNARGLSRVDKHNYRKYDDKEQVKDLENLISNFKVASAIIHYDETSPYMHIVGVPIKYKSKNGMSKQVGKSDVFTKTN